MKIVSAIITTHNRIELLKRAIKSVYSQTYPNIELIVVDDASTDGTFDYCKKLPLQYIHIPKSESKGGNYARNQGIRAAKGEYIAFLDDDDYWLSTKIEKQLNLIERKGCELVYCGTRIENVSTSGIIYQDRLPNPRYYGDMHKKILIESCTITSNILVSRQAILEVGMFDENLRYWQEYELTIRLAQRQPFYFVNEPLCVYRINLNDRHRITNRIDGWKESVYYIKKKHTELYKHLNYLERFLVKLNIMQNAAIRYKNLGDKKRYYQNRCMWKIMSLPFRVINKILITIKRWQLKKEFTNV